MMRQILAHRTATSIHERQCQAATLQVWKPAIQQAWKPALRRGGLTRNTYLAIV